MPPQGKHKRECSDDQPSTFPLNTSESEALVSPTRYGQSTISRASAQAKKDAGHAKGTDANASTSGELHTAADNCALALWHLLSYSGKQ